MTHETSGESHTTVFEQAATVSSWDDDYYHPIAERYYDAAVSDMIDEFGVSQDETVLDCGCGPGVHSIRVAKKGHPVLGIDISAEMLKNARERIAAAGVADKIDLMTQDLTAMTLDQQFKAVFSWGVVIHIPDADAAITNIANRVAPGGRLGLQLLNRNALDFRLERLIRRLTGKRFDAIEDTAFGTGVWYEYHGERLWVQRFDPALLDAEMAKRGFRLVSRRGAEFTEFQWRIGGPVRRLLLRLNAALYRTRLLGGLSCTQIHVYEKT